MSTTGPLVSIVTPVFNRERFLPEVHNSIQEQSYSNWEWLVVDDHSTDGSEKLLANYAASDGRIRYIRRDREPKGAPTCRNIGAANARGQYLIYLDSDDLLAPWCLEQRLARFAENEEKDFLVFPILLFQEKVSDGRILWNVDAEEMDLNRFLRLDAVWQTMGPIYRTDFIREKTSGFYEGLAFRQDLEFHIRLLLQDPDYLKFLGERPDCYLRRHGEESISQKAHASGKYLETDEWLFKRFAELIMESPSRKQVRKETIAMMMLRLANAYIVSEKQPEKAQGMLDFLRIHELSSEKKLHKMEVYHGFLVKLTNRRQSVFWKAVHWGVRKILIAKDFDFPPRTMNTVPYAGYEADNDHTQRDV